MRQQKKQGHGKPSPYGSDRRGSACRALPLLRTALLIIGLCLSLAGGSVQAQEGENRAGLVIEFSDGTTESYCFPFTGEYITGFDLLLKTGHDVIAETQGALGAWICKIGPDGCDFPEEHCACESFVPGGKYWTYSHLKEGTWKTSSLGSGSYKVRNGEVEGWAWSNGKGPSITPSFAEVCATQLPQQPQPTPTPTPPPPTNTAMPPQPTATQLVVQPTDTPQPPAPTATPRPSNTPTRAPSPTPQPVPPTEQLPLPAPDTPTPPAPSPTPAPTDTPMPVPTDTLAPTVTPTDTNTPEPSSTSTAKPAPTNTPTIAPTPTVTAIVQGAGTTPQTFVQIVAAGIALAVGGGLALWWFGFRGRRT